MKRRYKILTGLVAVVAVLLVSAALILSHDSTCAPLTTANGDASNMLAVLQPCYGPPDRLRVGPAARPTLADDQVLVKVRAAAVNPLDWHYMRGEPYIMRMESGIGAPKDARFGADFAGVVEAVGAKVTEFKPGDEVFGAGAGAFAEYLTVRARRAIAHKPANLSFEQAAAVPVAALTALQALRDKGGLKPGQKVLVNGASGGVGTFAVQIAKALGAEVTGVSSTRNLELVRSIGADHVIDYTRENFTEGAQRFDVIIDNVGNYSLLDARRVLQPNGSYVIVGGPKGGAFLGPLAAMLQSLALAPFISQRVESLLADVNPKDLGLLRDMLAAGTVRPVIDRTYRLSEVPEAIRYVESGRARGKVVIAVAGPVAAPPQTLGR